MPRLENEGFQNFHSQFLGRYNYSGLRFGLRLPAFSFTITCGNLTVGHFRLQLHVAILQWDYVLNDGFQLFRLQMHVAAPFTNACGRAVLPSGMSRFSRKPSRELLWKTDSRGPLIGLKNHLMKSISGILLNPSGKVVRILELTFLADSGVRALALVTAYVSATIRYPANFSSVIQSVPY